MSIDVYIAELPQLLPSEPLSSEARQREIDSISNDRVKREKYWAWKLLEYSLTQSFGADISKLSFEKAANGRWLSYEYEFSISHSGGVLAVAVSRERIGVDVERIRVKNSQRFAEYILSVRERESFLSDSQDNIDEALIKKWCQKEAIFKLSSGETFLPSKIETEDFFCYTKKFELLGETYILAVASDKENQIRIFDEIYL